MKHIGQWTGLCAVALGISGLACAETPPRHRHELNRLLRMLERGDYNRLGELLALPREETITALLDRLQQRDATARATALDLLGRIDLYDDQLLNTPAVIQALVRATDGSEKDETVIDEALRWLGGRGVPEWEVDPTVIDAHAIDALFARLAEGYLGAAYILGRTADPSLIARLQPHLADPDRLLAEATRHAMAKLGDEPCVSEVLAGLDSPSSYIQSNTFEALAYIGSARTVRRLVSFLDRPGGPPPEIGPSDRVVFELYRYMAAWALGHIVKDPPVRRQSRSPFHSEDDVTAWKAWWQAHERDYP